MLYKIVPGRNSIMKIFFIDIFQTCPSCKYQLNKSNAGKGKSLSLLIILQLISVFETIAQPKRTVVMKVISQK